LPHKTREGGNLPLHMHMYPHCNLNFKGKYFELSIYGNKWWEKDMFQSGYKKKMNKLYKNHFKMARG